MVTIHVFNLPELAEQGTPLPVLCHALDALGPELGLGAFKFGVRKRRLTLRLVEAVRLRWTPAQWVALFDRVNDVLDRYHVLAIAQSRWYRFRIGLHRRITFDCSIQRWSPRFGLQPLTAVFFGRMGDYQPRPETRVINTYGLKIESMIEWT